MTDGKRTESVEDECEMRVGVDVLDTYVDGGVTVGSGSFENVVTDGDIVVGVDNGDRVGIDGQDIDINVDGVATTKTGEHSTLTRYNYLGLTNVRGKALDRDMMVI